jgi:hypothetical protein
MAGLDAALRQILLDVPEAEGEPEVKPNGQPDDMRRKPVALEADWLHGHSSVLAKFCPETQRAWS